MTRRQEEERVPCTTAVDERDAVAVVIVEVSMGMGSRACSKKSNKLGLMSIS